VVAVVAVAVVAAAAMETATKAQEVMGAAAKAQVSAMVVATS
jgi:hypothetical protein